MFLNETHDFFGLPGATGGHRPMVISEHEVVVGSQERSPATGSSSGGDSFDRRNMACSIRALTSCS